MIASNVQEPPSAEQQSNVANKNTGFPEPLSEDRNTTLPHPDADTSANATIEAADIPLSRTQSRIHVRIPSFRRRNNGNNSKGDVSVTNAADMYQDIEYADGTKEGALADDIADSDDRDEQGYAEGGRKKGVLRKRQLFKV